MSRPRLHRAHSSAAVDPAPPSRLALCCLGPILNPERDNQYYELLGVDRRCSQTEIRRPTARFRWKCILISEDSGHSGHAGGPGAVHPRQRSV